MSLEIRSVRLIKINLTGIGTMVLNKKNYVVQSRELQWMLINMQSESKVRHLREL